MSDPRRKRANLPTYRLDDTELGMGASFGNAAIWVNTKNTGAIERVFCLGHGQSAIGTIVVCYALGGTPPGPGAPRSQRARSAARFVPMRPDGPLRHFELHPAYQRVTFSLAGSLRVEETTFVPLAADFGDAAHPAVYQTIALHNGDDRPHDVRITAFARLRGSLAEDVVVRWDDDARAFVAWNRAMPETARFFGLDTGPTAYETTFDFGRVYDPVHAHALSGATSAQGDVVGGLQLDTTLESGESVDFSVVAAAYAERDDAAAPRYASLPAAREALDATVAHLQDVLQRSCFLSPDPVLNDGALWSKVNMRRVMGRYPRGMAFTNDPGNTSSVVVRDASWFVYGSDHFMPEFSRALLDGILDVQYPSGKLPEYFDALDGRIEDNGLNINDDTPLFIAAVNHHFRSSGDERWLERVYPAVAKAARYILSQIDERGLVFCDARDPRGAVWASATWRNIIPGYSINGAVTEVNAECVGALRAAGHLASEAGHEDESEDFRAAADALRSAMDRHLVNPETGLHYLNIDVDGNKHSDVTGDLIFPVVFRACDDATAYRIISRLNAPDFATPAGVRTISRNDLRYDPVAYAGLLGGVWPGLTWWYAFGAARDHPDAMVNALRSSFRHYAADPRTHNTVPGQFSEYFDGESLVNRGMRLSPWEPPRFLWAAVEGVCGLTLTTGIPKVRPLVPDSWKWVALRNLPYHGTSITYVVTRERGALHVYGTHALETACAPQVFDEDVTAAVRVASEAAVAVALRKRPSSTLVFIGSVSPTTTTAPVDLSGVLEDGGAYAVRHYDSERDAWDEQETRDAADLCAHAVALEARGFRLIELEKR